MSRAPRQLLTSWVAHSRPVGCPQMTWGRTLENALKSRSVSKEFDKWFSIAKDRPKWRQQTYSYPIPHDARWLKDNSPRSVCRLASLLLDYSTALISPCEPSS